MVPHTLLILLGNQLFPNLEIANIQPTTIFMAEDFHLCTYEKHHKLKILMFLAAMREKRDELIGKGYDVQYQDIDQPDFKQSFEYKLKKIIIKKQITSIKMFEIEDKEFENRLVQFAEKERIPLEFQSSPMFLVSRSEFKSYVKRTKKLQMGLFYKKVRKELNLLVDKDLRPVGGKWSFDDENRRKIPKGLSIPQQYQPKTSKYLTDLKPKVESIFGSHPGKVTDTWMPLTRAEALNSLNNFLENKFKNFGTYEDAILNNNNFLFHSGISPSLNMGLITPKDIIEKILYISDSGEIPLNSIEGFLRQIIGWREFMRGIYQNYSDKQFNSNYFGFSKALKKNWYSGETGILPLDDAIKYSEKFGYTHHINRLMIIANIMTLSEVAPQNVYSWFMEMYLDSSEWVMTPNVFGMGTFADGGIFSTKPYICGSNYILKMSNYKKGEWCDTVDGLYWRFIEKNIETIKKNARMPFAEKTLHNMDQNRKKYIFMCAENFIDKNCY